MIQGKAGCGSDQDGSSGGGEQRLDAENVLTETTWLADGLVVEHDRGSRIKNNSKVFIWANENMKMFLTESGQARGDAGLRKKIQVFSFVLTKCDYLLDTQVEMLGVQV